MTADTNQRYPIVMERILFCEKCQRHTRHHSVIYPDTESNTCKVCDHKSTVHFNRSVAVVYKDIDKLELDGIMADLNELAGEIQNRKFGHIGKKDLQFIIVVQHQILAIMRRVKRLKEKE